MELQGHIAVVTGAARGIGLGIARALAQRGAHVIALDRLTDELESAATELRALGTVETRTLDVSDLEAMDALIEDVRNRHGKIDILVNNAGISVKGENGRRIPFLQSTRQAWDQTMLINLTSVYEMCRRVVPDMVQRKYGRIINIASQAGRTRPEFADTAYAAAKAGVIGLTRSIAEEVSQYGITANCVAPGRIDTPMVRTAGTEANALYAQRIPARRIGTTSELAAAVTFLASPEASFISGTTIDVNGGYFMT
ncbi:SDR family NAD(P)-dependent oxidoreductase [Bordetella sp. 15P40C-2]|uniref:SDR family NAD(P)-dependent oxidoreductase n=1 Tax=Bordetella sp. 15P40C-2 TaxID=2572246 RepID=UPI00132B9F94|nr:SDR family NAD(P)-dependent oxidoreductase [Bordetella sp. 15P40C-2]MVW72362.1 SDR family oxidoreductase [Bordetella sp. 15P40C-2]